MVALTTVTTDDAYVNSHVTYAARVRPGVLAPQNATGNFVKIVNAPPVRVELVGPVPNETPLFIGLSCTPYVKIREKPEGPNAGERSRFVPQAGDITSPDHSALYPNRLCSIPGSNVMLA